ncbi:hypothetical protein AVEN_117335-1 [Araneus ventricosus]|uniref:Uncharacterized protein n=1 Tax=Araneus ventricosus TaxID=182803 RepID=A0A4Y2JFY3_ARAVE|nr:hypothetical protein AVEN_117335-1 [Araneus ventricosus]
MSVAPSNSLSSNPNQNAPEVSGTITQDESTMPENVEPVAYLDALAEASDISSFVESGKNGVRDSNVETGASILPDNSQIEAEKQFEFIFASDTYTSNGTSNITGENKKYQNFG